MKKHWLDAKTGPHMYRVFVLNSKGKETPRYATGIVAAKRLLLKATSQALPSIICQRRYNGTWKWIGDNTNDLKSK